MVDGCAERDEGGAEGGGAQGQPAGAVHALVSVDGCFYGQDDGAWCLPLVRRGLGYMALGGSMLVFRIQRELEMCHTGEITWIPRCDWLLVSGTEIALLVVLLPLLVISHSSKWLLLPAAGCASASLLNTRCYECYASSDLLRPIDILMALMPN